MGVQGLRDISLEVESPRATLYVWSTIPRGYASQAFCFRVLEEAKVWMIPGSTYGKYGKGCPRIASIHPVKRLAEAMRHLQKFNL